MHSEVDIRKDLGKHIGIFPIEEDNIEGSCIILTASSYAWSVNKKKSCVEKDIIKIAAHDTVVIMTEEVVYLDSKFAGYCMTRVSIPPHGIASICTPVKPGWIGHLLITLHNISDQDYDFPIFKNTLQDNVMKSKRNGLVVLTIHKLRSSSKRSNPKDNARTDLLSHLGITLNQNEMNFVNEFYAANVKALFDRMRKSLEYKEIKKDLWKNPKRIFAIAYFLILIIIIVFLIVMYWNTSEPMPGILVNILLAGITGIPSIIVLIKEWGSI